MAQTLKTLYTPQKSFINCLIRKKFIESVTHVMQVQVKGLCMLRSKHIFRLLFKGQHINPLHEQYTRLCCVMIHAVQVHVKDLCMSTNQPIFRFIFKGQHREGFM